jgi:hypothetical protein
MASIPPISIESLQLVSSGRIFYLIWAIVIAAPPLSYNLLDARMGRPMRALRRGNVLVESLGIKLRSRMTPLDNDLLGRHPRLRAGMLRGALKLDRAEEASARDEELHQLRRIGLGDDPFAFAGNLPLGKQRLLEIARALAADHPSRRARHGIRDGAGGPDRRHAFRFETLRGVTCRDTGHPRVQEAYLGSVA